MHIVAHLQFINLIFVKDKHIRITGRTLLKDVQLFQRLIASGNKSSNLLGSRMGTSILVFLLIAASWRPVKAPDCCQTKTVRDAPEDSDLNGVYTLKTKKDTKPDPVCIDGCIYIRDNKEYCFKKQAGATPEVFCEVNL